MGNLKFVNQTDKDLFITWFWPHRVLVEHGTYTHAFQIEPRERTAEELDPPIMIEQKKLPAGGSLMYDTPQAEYVEDREERYRGQYAIGTMKGFTSVWTTKWASTPEEGRYILCTITKVEPKP